MSPLQTETVTGLSTRRRPPLSPRELPVVKSTSDDALPVPRRPEPRPPELTNIHVTAAIGTVRPENAAEMVRDGLPAVVAIYFVCGGLCDSVA